MLRFDSRHMCCAAGYFSTWASFRQPEGSRLRSWIGWHWLASAQSDGCLLVEARVNKIEGRSGPPVGTSVANRRCARSRPTSGTYMLAIDVFPFACPSVATAKPRGWRRPNRAAAPRNHATRPMWPRCGSPIYNRWSRPLAHMTAEHSIERRKGSFPYVKDSERTAVTFYSEVP